LKFEKGVIEIQDGTNRAFDAQGSIPTKYFEARDFSGRKQPPREITEPGRCNCKTGEGPTAMYPTGFELKPGGEKGCMRTPGEKEGKSECDP